MKPTPSSMYTVFTCLLITILLQFPYDWPLPPITGNTRQHNLPIRASKCIDQPPELNNSRRSLFLGIVLSHIQNNSTSRATTHDLSYFFYYILYVCPW